MWRFYNLDREYQKKEKVSNYSIKDLEHLSGIKAHTIRIWEQRYNFIKPSRTDTNIRYYDDKDLRLVLNISLLKDNGYKISKIAKMTDQQMSDAVLQITEKHLRHDDQIHALTLSMVDLDEDRFEKIMSTNILKIGFEKTMISIIYPFLSKIGVLWQTGGINPAQEHFISNLIRQKLIVAIDSQFVSIHDKAKKFLLYLPEGELHEVSLLFSNYIIRSRKNRTIYLGQSLPYHDLRAVYDLHQPEYVMTIITSSPGPGEVQDYVNKLCKDFPKSTVLLTGFQVVGQDIETPENGIILNRLDELIDFVEQEALAYAS